ncbi:MAG: hypothetical protein IT208_07690 [Chthonomonadales bacterium]|nr:hypothetical protein [Chthonomonadales bacterium]
MNPLAVGFGALLSLAATIAWLFVLVDAFRSSVGKGILALLCGLYWLYYAVFEFEHEHKWLIVILAIAGGAIGSATISAGGRL